MKRVLIGLAARGWHQLGAPRPCQMISPILVPSKSNGLAAGNQMHGESHRGVKVRVLTKGIRVTSWALIGETIEHANRSSSRAAAERSSLDVHADSRS